MVLGSQTPDHEVRHWVIIGGHLLSVSDVSSQSASLQPMQRESSCEAVYGRGKEDARTYAIFAEHEA